jgi:hypothetical protein
MLCKSPPKLIFVRVLLGMTVNPREEKCWTIVFNSRYRSEWFGRLIYTC